LFRSVGLDLNFAGGVFSLTNTRTDSPAAIPGWSFSRTDTNGTATALDLAGNVIQFPSRTNLLLRSQEFDNAAWTKGQATVTANNGTAPDGSTTADLLTEGTGTVAPTAYQERTITNATPYTGSIFVKRGSGSRNIALRVELPAVYIAVFNLTTGALVSVTAGASATITALADGWFFCTITATSNGAGGGYHQTVMLSGTSYASYTGDGTSGVLLWGAQLETGSTATAYIPTTTAAVTVVLPRITNRGVLVEEARTNSLPQSDVTGVVAGTPGTNPTGWQVATNASGLTKSIIGSGTEGGRSYVDIRFSGTPSNTNSGEIIPQATTGVAALNGQVWTGSFFLALVGGTLTNLTPSINIQEISAVGATLATTIGTTLTPTATTVRSSTTRTNNNVLTAHERLVLNVGIVSAGVAVDATFRLSLPQLELGAFATSPIITTGAAGTRVADSPIATGLAMLLNGTLPNTVIIEAEWVSRGDTRIYAEGYTGGSQSGATFQSDAGGTRPRLINRTGATRTDSGSSAAVISNGATVRLAIVSDGRLASQGVVLASGASPAQADWSGTLAIGHRYNAGTPQFSCCTYIRRVQVLPYAATDAQLQALTAP
jgi:hypothetical protein